MWHENAWQVKSQKNKRMKHMRESIFHKSYDHDCRLLGILCIKDTLHNEQRTYAVHIKSPSDNFHRKNCEYFFTSQMVFFNRAELFVRFSFAFTIKQLLFTNGMAFLWGFFAHILTLALNGRALCRMTRCTIYV